MGRLGRACQAQPVVPVSGFTWLAMALLVLALVYVGLPVVQVLTTRPDFSKARRVFVHLHSILTGSVLVPKITTFLRDHAAVDKARFP